jgi:Protein of unknown function (DUF3617)
MSPLPLGSKALKSLINLLLLLAFHCSSSAQTIMNQGGWEFVLESVITDKQGVQRKGGATNLVCVTKPMLVQNIYLDPRYEKVTLEAQGGQCDLSEHKRNGNSASFKISCSMPRNVKLSAAFRKEASATGFKSEVNQVMVNDPRGVEMDNRTTGTFIGSCTDTMLKPEVRKVR